MAERVDPAAADRYGAARAALSAIPLAVVLVGAGRGTDRSCATGTAMYVSFAPPRVAIALHPGSRTNQLVESTGRFSLSMLRADQQDVAVSAGRGGGGQDKFAALGLATVDGPDGSADAPALADALARVWCRVIETHPVGDHRLVVGEVTAYDRSPLDAPDPGVALVRHQRRYASIGPWLSDEAPEGYPT